MRWVALLLVAGCGRIAFDPLGEGGGPGDGDGDGGGGNGDGMLGDIDAAMATCTPTYGSGANSFLNGSSAMATAPVPASSMANTLIVVQVSWAASTESVNSVTDTKGNTYTAATQTNRVGTISQVMYIAPYAVGAAGTLTVNFAASVPNPMITYATYTNVNLASTSAGIPSTAQGSNISPVVQATNVTAPAMLVAGLTSNVSGASAGAGYQERAGLSGSHLQDRCAATSGAYGASATLGANGTWILQLVPIRTL